MSESTPKTWQEEHRVRCALCNQVFVAETDTEAYAKFNRHWNEKHAEKDEE